LISAPLLKANIFGHVVEVNCFLLSCLLTGKWRNHMHRLWSMAVSWSRVAYIANFSGSHTRKWRTTLTFLLAYVWRLCLSWCWWWVFVDSYYHIFV